MTSSLDLCVGCSIYKNEDGDYCDYSIHNNKAEGICPCCNCVIKPMCQVTCDEWQAWIDIDYIPNSL